MKNEKIYSLTEALTKIKKEARAKFDESVEIHLRTGIDPKKGEQQIRSTCVLPHGTGKTKRVAVFTDSEEEIKTAQEAGADVVGGKELIQKIKTKGVIEFEVAVATPEIMKALAQIAKILGPKGLMPSPKNETVTKNISQTVVELKKGKVTIKNDETGNIHQSIGKISWEDDKLKENYEVFLEAINKAKPAGVKGIFIKNIALCSTMGKSVRVEV